MLHIQLLHGMMTDATYFYSFTFENICLWQHITKKRCGGDDQVLSIWSQSFFYKSATVEHHES